MIKLVAKRRVWKQMNKAVSQLQDEYKICFDDERIYIKTVDPAHVAMVEVSIPQSVMNCYQDATPETEGFKDIGVDADRIAMFINICMPNEDITMRFDGVKIKFDGLMMDGTGANYRCNALSTEGMRDVKVPNITLPWTFVATVAHMRNCIKLLEKISDQVELKSTAGIVTLLAEDNTHGADMVIGMSNIADKDCRSFYPMDYFSNAFKYLQDVDSVRITMGHDLPMKMEAVTIDKVSIKFILAPKIHNEGI